MFSLLIAAPSGGARLSNSSLESMFPGIPGLRSNHGFDRTQRLLKKWTPVKYLEYGKYCKYPNIFSRECTMSALLAFCARHL